MGRMTDAERQARADSQRLFDWRVMEDTKARMMAQTRAESDGKRNQRLAELTAALRTLNADSWRGMDPAVAAQRVLPVLESMVED